MIQPPVPQGHVAVEFDIRENDAGRAAASEGTDGPSSGRAFQNDHASAFAVNARRVPIDSAAVCSAGARALRDARAIAGRLAAPARG
jgi:hypothetical protein